MLEELDGNDVTLVKYAADDRGLHTSAALASGEKYTYAYDAYGNFTDASSTLHKVEQRHDERKLAADLRDGLGIEHEYDQAGVRLSVFLQRFRIEYTSDEKGFTVETPDGSQHRFWREADSTLARENGNGTGKLKFSTLRLA